MVILKTEIYFTAVSGAKSRAHWLAPSLLGNQESICADFYIIAKVSIGGMDLG